MHGEVEGDGTALAADCLSRRDGADGGPAWRCRTEDDGDWEHYHDGGNRVVRFKQERRDNEEGNGEQKGSAASPSRVETDLVLEEWEEEGQGQEEQRRPPPPRQPPPLPPPPLPRSMAVLLTMNNPQRPRTTSPLTATKRQASYKLGSRRGRAAKAAERAEQAEATKAEEAKAAAEAAEAAAADAAEAARAMKARRKAALKATQAEEAAAAAWVRFHRPEGHGRWVPGGGGAGGAGTREKEIVRETEETTEKRNRNQYNAPW